MRYLTNLTRWKKNIFQKMWINGEGFQSDTIGVGLKKSADVVETQLIESKVTGKQRVQVLVTLPPRGLL